MGPEGFVIEEFSAEGEVRLGDGATAAGVESVNGGIETGSDVTVDGGISVVNGEIEVVCEFCSTDYHFKPHEFDDHKH